MVLNTCRPTLSSDRRGHLQLPLHVVECYMPLLLGLVLLLVLRQLLLLPFATDGLESRDLTIHVVDVHHQRIIPAFNLRESLHNVVDALNARGTLDGSEGLTEHMTVSLILLDAPPVDTIEKGCLEHPTALKRFGIVPLLFHLNRLGLLQQIVRMLQRDLHAAFLLLLFVHLLSHLLHLILELIPQDLTLGLQGLRSVLNVVLRRFVRLSLLDGLPQAFRTLSNLGLQLIKNVVELQPLATQVVDLCPQLSISVLQRVQLFLLPFQPRCNHLWCAALRWKYLGPHPQGLRDSRLRGTCAGAASSGALQPMRVAR
mmetsp:Transcript_61137/g.162424  ORF Transcript_61137/g.162424 Transcript_61137/m.162424 type:complete len:314 (-) Transcript_61137:349-1290(-)